MTSLRAIALLIGMVGVPLTANAVSAPKVQQITSKQAKQIIRDAIFAHRSFERIVTRPDGKPKKLSAFFVRPSDQKRVSTLPAKLAQLTFIAIPSQGGFAQFSGVIKVAKAFSGKRVSKLKLTNQ